MCGECFEKCGDYTEFNAMKDDEYFFLIEIILNTELTSRVNPEFSACCFEILGRTGINKYVGKILSGDERK